MGGKIGQVFLLADTRGRSAPLLSGTPADKGFIIIGALPPSPVVIATVMVGHMFRLLPPPLLSS